MREGLDYRSLLFVKEVYKQLKRVVRDMTSINIDSKDWHHHKRKNYRENNYESIRRSLTHGSVNK